MTKIVDAKVPKLTKSQRGLRDLPPEKSITPIAKSIEKEMMPKSGLGKPKTAPCSLMMALPQFMKGFRLQGI
jgi:hypothetical protein